MEYITLNNSDLTVSRLCMGGCPLGGHGWGIVHEDELLQAIQTALNNGVTFFDTADIYGLGKSEEMIGRSVKELRSKVIIASKFGVRIENGVTYYDNSPEWIQTALENSLRRLDTEYIDLYQIHYRDNKIPLSSIIESLELMKEKGYIRYYGLSNIYEKDIEELKLYTGRFVSFQNEFSLACRKNEKDILKLSKNISMTPLTWGSLGQGVLTGKYDIDSTFDSKDRRSRETYVNFHGEKYLKNLKIVDVIKDIANKLGKKPSAIAIRWILDYIEDSVVLAGIKNANQLLDNIEAFGWSLDKNQIKALNEISA